MVYIPYTIIYHISLWPAHLQPSLDPAAGGRRKQQGSLEQEGREEQVRMEEGKRCSWPAAHTASAADSWRLGVRTEELRERVGGRYKRETLMGLAQANIA